MNIPIEYALRNGKIEKMLVLPCCLFLENLFPKKKNKSDKVALILTATDQEMVVVTRYDLNKQKQNATPEFSSKNTIPKSAIFNSPLVILQRMKMLPYYETPYLFRGKQEQSMPNSAIQESNYLKIINEFYSSSKNQENREKWLWKIFEKINISKEISRNFGGIDILQHQQEIIRNNFANCWNLWSSWKNTFLAFTGIAAELVFYRVYKNQVISPTDSLDELLNRQIGVGLLGSRQAPRRIISFDHPWELPRIAQSRN